MLESIFDDSLVNNDIEMLDISDPVTPDVQVMPVVEQPKIEPVEQIVKEVKTEPKTKTKDNIFILQVTLLIAWAILTTVVYFFGYPLFEPFIGV